jgi:4-hydroxybenzoate polyprenyltransferase
MSHSLFWVSKARELFRHTDRDVIKTACGKSVKSQVWEGYRRRQKELQPNASSHGRASTLLAMMHLPSCVMMGFAVILGETIASPTVPAQAAFWGFMTGFFLLSVYMVLNELDRETGTGSQQKRILSTDVVRPKEAFSFAVVLASFGLLSAAYLGLLTLMIALLSVVIIVAYHVRVKKRGLLGNVFVGTNMAITFIFAGFAVGSLTWPLAIFAMMAFLVSMGREIMKNLAKAFGDSSVGTKLEPRSPAYAETGKQSSLLFFATVVLSILPLVLGLVSNYYIPLVAICDIGFLLTAYSMITSPTPRNAKRNENYVLVWLSFGLLAFVIGTI